MGEQLHLQHENNRKENLVKRKLWGFVTQPHQTI